MNSIDKYIGIPYVFNGDTLDGTDCLGLCRIFYADHGWSQTFMDGKPILSPSDRHNGMRLGRYLFKNMRRVDIDSMEFGDIMLFNIDGDAHCGIYVGCGDCLAMQVPCGEQSRSMIYHKRFWKRAFKGAFTRG